MQDSFTTKTRLSFIKFYVNTSLFLANKFNIDVGFANEFMYNTVLKIWQKSGRKIYVYRRAFGTLLSGLSEGFDFLHCEQFIVRRGS